MRLAALALCAAALSSCAAGQGDRPERRPLANPSAVIAAELALARMAQEKGYNAALRQFAAADAVLLGQGPLAAQNWQKRGPEVSAAPARQVHGVWTSCDGSLSVTRGAWQRADGTDGVYITVWERARDRSHRWKLDRAATLDAPLEAPEFVQARVAECPGAGQGRAPAAPAPADLGGCSLDATLCWAYTRDPGSGDAFRLAEWDGSARENVLEQPFPVPAE